MRIAYQDFESERFDFAEEPVLVLERFWSEEEMRQFRSAMDRSSWQTLKTMPQVEAFFRNCGDWAKAELVDPEKERFLHRVMMPCVERYAHSFSDVRQGVLSFNYFAYRVGDCLSIHDDTDSGDVDDPKRERVRRRIAVTSYVHERWEPNWGGELIIYDRDESGEGPAVRACIPPVPGSLVMFTVPRLHRVCRVDPLAGPHRRLSIAGWVMTEHGS